MHVSANNIIYSVDECHQNPVSSEEPDVLDRLQLSLHCLFQNVKDTDCTDLPDGITVTITSGPNDIQHFFFLSDCQTQEESFATALLLFAAFDLYTKHNFPPTA